MATPEKYFVREGNWVKVVFPFSKWTIAQVKKLVKRRWDSSQKVWFCENNETNKEKLLKWGFVDNDLPNGLTKFPTQLNVDKKQNYVSVDSSEVRMMPGLRKYQKQGVLFTHSREGRVLIADDMGLGKTIQAIGYLYSLPKKRPAVIVCPATVKFNWENEIRKWLPHEKIVIASGQKPSKLQSFTILIINYDILHYWSTFLRKKDIEVLILDECQYLKNMEAKRTKAARRLSKTIPNLIALSGTPIENHPYEFYSILSMIDKQLFTSSWEYAEAYCAPRFHERFGWDFTGSSNSEGLNNLLTSTIMIRRKKTEVAKEIPEKTRIILPLELTNRKEYTEAKGDFIQYLRKTKGEKTAKRGEKAKALVQLSYLKQLTVEGKIKACLDWIADFVETGNKIVAFAAHRKTIDYIMSKFPKIAVKIDGSCSQSARKLAVEKFQTDPNTLLMVGNIKAAGVGITLVAASNACFVELADTPTKQDQAEDRICRIGQKAKQVNIYYLIGRDSVEEPIMQMLDTKRKVIDKVIDGHKTEEIELLTYLMEYYLSV